MRVLFGPEIIEKFVSEAKDIILDNAKHQDNIAIVGIKTGGFFLAKRIYERLKSETQQKNINFFFGSIDITFWRDDLTRNPHPIVKGTEMNFPVDDAKIYLIDDVIYTGRTVRAALSEIFEFGRPKEVRLFTLINRVGRELPIHPDFFSAHLKVNDDEIVEVMLKEKGAEKDGVLILEKGEKI
jgi:pyrimidine operon attenuation protein/uracil phosphoribosyltransferase